MSQTKNLSDVIKNKLFSGINEQNLRFKLNQKDFEEVKEGEILYKKGDKSEYLYLIINGEVKLKIPGVFSSPIILRKVKDEYFGEKELLESTARTSSAVADTDCLLYKIKNNILRALINNHHIIYKHLMNETEEEQPEEDGIHFTSNFEETNETLVEDDEFVEDDEMVEDDNMIESEDEITLNKDETEEINEEQPEENIPEENSFWDKNRFTDADNIIPEEHNEGTLDTENPYEAEVDFPDEIPPLEPKQEEQFEEETEDLFAEEDVTPEEEQNTEPEVSEEFLKWDFSEGGANETEADEDEKEETNFEEPDHEESTPEEKPLFESHSLEELYTPPIEEEKPEDEDMSFPEAADFNSEEYEGMPASAYLNNFHEEENPADEEEQYEEEGNFSEEETENELNEQLEEKIPEEEKDMALLKPIIDSLQKINSTANLHETILAVSEEAAALTDAEAGRLFLIDRLHNEIWTVQQGAENQEIRLNLEEGLIGTAIEKEEIISIPDLISDPRFEPEIEGVEGMHHLSLLYFPIKNKEERLIALLQLFNSRNSEFSKSDEELLVSLSPSFASALEKAKLETTFSKKDKLNSLSRLANFLLTDIKRPILSINNYIEHIKKEALPENSQQILAMLNKQANSVVDLVQSVQNFAEEKEPPRQSKENFREVMDDVLALLAEYVETRNVKLFKKYQVTAEVKINKKEFYQACYQIAKNACDAMPGGGNLYVTIRKEGSSVRIDFKDSGKGIPTEIIEKIYEPFFSFDKKNATGLGLSLAKKILKDHSGSISVKSTEGSGTTVSIFLPTA